MLFPSLDTLGKLNIPVVSQDTGGNYGRTVELYAETGDFLIKTIGHRKKMDLTFLKR